MGCADFPCCSLGRSVMGDAGSEECRAGRAPPAAGSPAQPRAGIGTTPRPVRGALTPTPPSLRLNPAAGGGDAPRRRRRDNYWPGPSLRASWSSGSAISAWERPGGAPRDPLSLGVSQQKPFPVICSAVSLPQLNLCGSCCLTCPQVWAKKTLVPP